MKPGTKLASDDATSRSSPINYYHDSRTTAINKQQ